MATWQLALGLLALSGLAQLGLWLLARALGARLPRRVALAGSLLPWLLFAPWLSPERLLVPTASLGALIPGTPPAPPTDAFLQLNDAVNQFLPWELEVRRLWRDGGFPFWSELSGGGSSPWANPQAGALSPLGWATRAFPIQYFFLVALWLKVMVAFEGAWLLSRKSGASRWASWVAATCFGLGGGIFGWAFFPHSTTAAFLPWLVLGAVTVARRPRARTVAATGLVTALVLLSGHPETAAGGGLLAAVAALALGRRRRRAVLSGIGAAALAATLGFALAAPQLLPFAAHARDSQRATDTLALEGGALQPSGAKPWRWSYEWRGRLILSPTNPQAYGMPYGDTFRGVISWPDCLSGYAGLVGLGGALAALAAGRRRARPWLLVAGAYLVLAAHPVLLHEQLYRLPPLRLFAYSRLLLPMTLAVAIAAAHGLDALHRRRPGWRPWLGWAAAAGVSLAVAPAAGPAGLWLVLTAALVLAVIAPRLLPAGSRTPGPWPARLATLLLAAGVLGDLLPWARRTLPEGRPDLFYPANPLIEAIRRETEAAGGPFRAVGQDRLIYPDLLPAYGIAEVRPHNPLAPQQQLDVLGAAFGFAPTMQVYYAPFNRPDQPFLDFLNVRAVVSVDPLPQPAGLELVPEARLDVYTLWRNPDALPRWFLASGVDLLPDRPALGSWLAGLKDARRVAVVGPLDDGAPVGALPGEEAAGRIARRTRVEVQIAGPGPRQGDRLLATSLPDPESWRAVRRDGRPLEKVVVNGAFLGARIPPGVDRLVLLCRPAGVAPGFALAALAALLMVALGLAPPGRWRGA
ncbi:MAG TPA: hypothetical protein VF017_20805 [Thermoanaerobaculia bacterium]|nr:hypothetical protein [Thermoanaerobaculia bacterium]